MKLDLHHYAAFLRMQPKVSDIVWHHHKNEHALGLCKRPVLIKSRQHGNKVLVPCRHCFPCRRKRQSAQIGRMMAENTSSFGYVETLTYSDENLPDVKNWQPDDLLKSARAIIRRVERHVGKRPRYYLIAQLGEVTYRLHWHLIYWFPEPIWPKISNQTYLDPGDYWKHGGRTIDVMSPASARYVSDYLTHPGKNTVWKGKSPNLGEAYFREWLTKPPTPLIPEGCYDVRRDNQFPLTYPMDQRFREIALENGRLPPTNWKLLHEIATEYQQNMGDFVQSFEERDDILLQKRKKLEAQKAELVRPDIKTQMLLHQLRGAKAADLQSPRENWLGKNHGK